MVTFIITFEGAATDGGDQPFQMSHHFDFFV
jgi:hypothetical protein